MSTPEPPARKNKETPDTDVQREIRFAVVMYGGVSLAIYINGVTQELLHLVRATARNAGDNAMLFPRGELSPTEDVYREIAQQIDQQAGLFQTGDLSQTRFVVDVISGTSAGGINGVFLAKALARNQTMSGLKNLWLSEGDFGKLLNDTKAEDYSSDQGFAVQKPEASLLNSQRMYRKLLEALAGMAKTTTAGKDVTLAKELDLFVTTTDIEGIPLPIQLADKVVYERRYRNVFHFRYATTVATGNERDDFKKENDPFLAFAARCTSSFPFAFDAMQLADVDPILHVFQGYENGDPTEREKEDQRGGWDDFFRDYLRLGLFDIDKKSRREDPTGAPDDALSKLRTAFRNRSFGDGGYLDNKPFSYATSMLTRRQANCVVERRLLYVEPTPDHPELSPKKPGPRPDFAKNIRAAVLDLPRQETIREDIDRLYERNRLLDRIAGFAQHVDEDVVLLTERNDALEHAEFGEADLKTMINIYGVNYGTYHRLKVAEVTTFLAETLARALGHDPDSDAALAIRELVAAWRRSRYRPFAENGSQRTKPKTENQFLLDFDIRYSLRRLSFLNRRVNELAQGSLSKLDENSAKLLGAWLEHLEKAPTKKEREKPDLLRTAKELRERIERANPKKTLESDWVATFRSKLVEIKREKIAKALVAAREAEESFVVKGSKLAKDLWKAATDFNFSWEKMQEILREKDQGKRQRMADDEFAKRKKKLEGLTCIIKAALSKREGAQLTIATKDDVDLMRGDVAGRVFLDYYYRNFVLYDLITYPVEYGTDAGEANIVQVYRVSPEDASAIMEEHAGQPREKLAGRTLMSFGAFLDEGWRKNDIIWGRLDGAERLIKVLLPDADEQSLDRLIDKAHHGILLEEIKDKNGDAVCRLLGNALAHCDLSSPRGQKLQALVRKLIREPDVSAPMRESLGKVLDAPQKLDQQLPPQRELEYISRSTNIIGDMLSGLADKKHFDSGKRLGAWIARVGTVLWGLIAVAVPQSLGSLLVRHWLHLLYFVAITLLVFGIVNPAVKFAGWEFLGIVVALHLIIIGLRSYLSSKRPHETARSAGYAAVAFVPVGLIAIGILHLIERGFHFSLNPWTELAIAGAIAFGASLFVFNRRQPLDCTVSSEPREIPAPAPPSANNS